MSSSTRFYSSPLETHQMSPIKTLHKPAVPNLVPAGIFLPAKAFPNARGILFGTKLIG